MGLADGDVRRGLVTRQVVDVLKAQDRHETAEDLQRRFDAPEEEPDPVDEADFTIPPDDRNESEDREDGDGS